MGLFTGRHSAVMPASQYARAKSKGELPDIYIGSAELEFELDPRMYDDLIHAASDLPEADKRRIETEEGFEAPSTARS